jgi:hypothetical protein
MFFPRGESVSIVITGKRGSGNLLINKGNPNISKSGKIN